MNTKHHSEPVDALHEDARSARSGRYVPATQEAVQGELEQMLSSSLFAQSNRCKGFLSYVVQETLAGHANQLKERTIGVSVFERACDYDTGDDSIVRVTANDVRKRISQYYQESQAVHKVQIDLPRGSYVPEFLLLRRRGGKADDRKRFDGNGSSSDARAGFLTDDSEAISDSPAAEPSSPTLPIQAGRAPAGTVLSRRSVQVAAAIVLATAGLAAIVIWRSGVHDAPPSLWEPFSHSGTPVLICLGEHDIPGPVDPSASSQPTVADFSLHKQMIPVDDAIVIAALANQLGKRSIPFRLAGAEQISFTDFQRQPVILIGAVDNKWTLRLVQGLRYPIVVTYPSGPDIPPIASIVEANKPGNSPWMVDFSAPLSEWKKDYAILARVDDATTGVPVLIEAGLGGAGSIAASELLTSGALAGRLKDEPHCRSKASFEAVVETDIIEGKPGPPHILSLDCW